MLDWYKNLYVGDTAKKRERSIRRKINLGIGTVGIYVITMAMTPPDQLDILPAYELMKKQIRKRCPMIVGLAVGRQEALELTERIVKEVWERTGTVDVRAYLLEQNEDGGKK